MSVVGLGLVVAISACGGVGSGGSGGAVAVSTAPWAPVQTRVDHIGDRSYRIYDPPGARALLIALHGFHGTANTFETLTGFDQIAVQDGFRVVYPDGFHNSWDAGFCCGDAASTSVDDVAFLSALILRERPPSAIVFMAGFSNGAFMAYRMACRAPGLLTAIAVVGEDSEECTPAGSPTGSPLPAILAIQGTADDKTGNRVWGFRNGAWTNTEPSATGRWKKLGAAVTLVSVPGGIHEWYRSKPDATVRAADFFLGFLSRD